MSGQPVKTPADINKFRNEYMQSLNLQEKINDMNLQANKTYLLTGQLPPQSQLQDTRTNAEKLKDVENLKMSIASDLRPIAEPQFGINIVEAVMNSPLNVDNSLLRFLAQRASNIANELSRVYKFGIAGDDNDLQIIVQFISNMYADQQGKFQTTKTYIQSQTSQGVRGGILSANDIDPVIIDLQDLIKEINLLKSTIPPVVSTDIMEGLDNIKYIMIACKNFLPTSNQLKLMLDDMTQVDLGEDINAPHTLDYPSMKQFFDKLEELPKAIQLKTIIQKMKKYLKSQNWGLLSKSILSFKEMINPIDEIMANPRTNKMIELIQNQKNKEQQVRDLQAEQTREFIQRQTQEQKNASNAKKVYIVNPITDPVYIHPSTQGDFGELQRIQNQQIQNQVFQDVEQARNQEFYDAIEDEEEPDFYDAIDEPNLNNVGQLEDIDENIDINDGLDVNEMRTLLGNPNVRQSLAVLGIIGLTAIAKNFFNLYPNQISLPEFKTLNSILYNENFDFEDEYDFDNNYNLDRLFNNPDYYDDEPFNYFNNYEEPDNYRIGHNWEKSNWDKYIMKNDFGEGKWEIYEVKKNNDGEYVYNLKNNLGQKASNIREKDLDKYFTKTGKGLKIKKNIKPMKGRGIIEVEKPYNYIGFGINEINKSKLEKGILTIRRKNKSNYPDMPSRRISTKLSNVIKTMVGGSMPKFEDLNSLDEDEKLYLSKLVKKSNLEDRLSVPAPSKDQQEKDIHNFEVMKGQLMSGNDSLELVKKFKLLIRKLSKQGLLPKADVDDLNDLLSDLGY
jgi:hypothetical protein